jgi:transposase
MTEVGAAAMQTLLDRFAATLPEGVHLARLRNGAGWHTAGELAVPANVSLIVLPPSSPTPNPAERLWLELRDRVLSLRLFRDLDDIIDPCCDARNRITAEPGPVASLTHLGSIKSARIA